MKQLTAFALAAATLALAPADTRAGPAETAPVLEIVTFRLKPGTDVDGYLAAARATEAFLRETGAVRWRRLVRSEDGTWTDVIEWSSLSAAKAAETEAMTRPEFGAFFEAFDPESLEMRHAPVLFSMD